MRVRALCSNAGAGTRLARSSLVSSASTGSSSGCSRIAMRRGLATGWTINTADNRTAYVGTESKAGMTNPLRFKQKAVIVTGGASGIGKHCVREFAWEGACVAIVDTDRTKGTALEHEIKRAYGEASAVFYPTDVSDARELVHSIDDFASRNGGRLHTLVNNAVYFGSKALDATPADFAKSFGVNTIPAAIATNAARRFMLPATPHGRNDCSIVNMCSISSHAAQINRWTYAASKGALLQMTRTMALDLGSSGVRVNSVSPAWIWSPIQYDAVKGEGGKAATLPAFEKFHMLRRVGEAREVARAVLFLASNDASFITGTDLPVDGGYLSLGPEGLGESSVFVDKNTA